MHIGEKKKKESNIYNEKGSKLSFELLENNDSDLVILERTCGLSAMI